MEMDYLIAYTSIGSVLIPISVVLAHGKNMPRELRPLLWILITSLLCDLASIVLSRYSINTFLILNIYWFIQTSLLTWMYRKYFHRKQLVNFIYFFFVAFYLINILFFQGPWVLNSISNVLASLILILFCMYYFYRLLNDLPTVHIHSLPMLWISFAVLVYYAGNFFLFLASNYLIEDAREMHRMAWILHNLLNITKNILFAVALWQSYRKVKSSTSSSLAP